VIRVDSAEHRLFRSVGRIGHSLTLLGSNTKGAADASAATAGRWVLAFGGLGRNRYRPPYPPASWYGREIDPGETAIFHDRSKACVMRWPVLIDIADPARSITDLEAELEIGFARYHHSAFGFGELDSEGLLAARRVLILGGTLRPPRSGLDDAWVWNWDMSREYLRRTGGRMPMPEEAINAISFDLDGRMPAASSFARIAHPARAPDKMPTRVYYSSTAVPGFGLVLAGGEVPGIDRDDPIPLASIGVYLTREERLAELATRLATPRTRHGAILVHDEGNRRSLFLIGGRVEKGVPDVEEFPLPPAR